MGRGLSELQKTILGLALKQRQTEHKDRTYSIKEAADVQPVKVLMRFYGWKPTRYVAFSGYKFSPEDIGRAKYNRGRAALSRALASLQKRGLVECRYAIDPTWWGYFLTDAGVELAESLTVNETAK